MPLRPLVRSVEHVMLFRGLNDGQSSVIVAQISTGRRPCDVQFGVHEHPRNSHGGLEEAYDRSNGGIGGKEGKARNRKVGRVL